MISLIKGTILNKNKESVIIENNGIGYLVFTSFSTLSTIGNVEDTASLYTYLHVREDNLSLYGFSSPEEKHAFLLLISVSGVGPKAALSILSTISTTDFSMAIISGDSNVLSKSPGIGKKLAQRIILELKDKIKKDSLLDADNDGNSIQMDLISENSAFAEATSALVVLGYSQSEAVNALSKTPKDIDGLENILKYALKNLSSN